MEVVYRGAVGESMINSDCAKIVGRLRGLQLLSDDAECRSTLVPSAFYESVFSRYSQTYLFGH